LIANHDQEDQNEQSTRSGIGTKNSFHYLLKGYHHGHGGYQKQNTTQTLISLPKPAPKKQIRQVLI